MVRFALFALTTAVVSAFPSNVPADLQVKRDEAPSSSRLGPSTPEERAQAVKDVFRVSWDGYYTYAFPSDELRPVSNNGSNSR